MGCSLQIPASVHVGINSIEKLTEVICHTVATKVALFTDKGVREAGLCNRAIEILSEQNVAYEIFDSVIAEPSFHDIEHIIKQVSDTNVDLILAIGGGSVMDTAKLASVLLGSTYTILDLIDDASLAKKMVRTIMVPTTCGTGSEATCNAIISIPEESSKKGIVNISLIPDEVILDVQMIEKLPKSILAATGVDALAHCVECFTGKKANILSDAYAKVGASLIFSNLVKAYTNPDDLEAKLSLMVGAYFGGIAITGSGTTAVHGLSYPLGGKYHIPHGVSNAILFAPVMNFNRKSCQPQLAQLFDTVNPCMPNLDEETKSRYLVDQITEIVRDTEIPVSLKKFGINKTDLDFLVKAGFQQQRLLANNPKLMSENDIQMIYESVL